jgi:hypothetical protein
MQGNQNLNQSTNKNSDYARLADDLPPYQPQPVIIDDTQPHYGQPVHYNPNYNQPQPYNQAQPYNQLPYAQNQGFNNQPLINQNQGLDNPVDQAHQRRCASMLRCLSLTVIIENLVYIIFDIVYSGLTLNIVFFLMIIEAILFGYYLSQIKNGMVSHEKFTQARKAFMATCIMYILYFIVTGVIIIVLVNDVNPQIDTATIIIILIISTLIFLIPRFIGLCVTKNVSPQHVMLIPNR